MTPKPAGPLIADLLARATFPPKGTAVTAAVSGGADSLALLVLAVEAGLECTAVHVDHGLRPGSADEAGVVEAACARLGARFIAETVDVQAGPNLEARAREARYAVLPPDVMTGHTADDQAETALLNLLRGAALPGLAGMRPGPRRPLLRLRRADTETLCCALGLEPVRDPSNLDPSFRRNRVRHELLPLLDAIAERDIAAVLARQADIVRADDDLLVQLAGAIDVTDAAALAVAPLPLARRAVRKWLAGAGDGSPPSAGEVERVLAVARVEAAACEVSGGRRVERSGMRLRLTRPNVSGS